MRSRWPSRVQIRRSSSSYPHASVNSPAEPGIRVHSGPVRKAAERQVPALLHAGRQRSRTGLEPGCRVHGPAPAVGASGHGWRRRPLRRSREPWWSVCFRPGPTPVGGLGTSCAVRSGSFGAGSSSKAARQGHRSHRPWWGSSRPSLSSDRRSSVRFRRERANPSPGPSRTTLAQRTPTPAFEAACRRTSSWVANGSRSRRASSR